MTVPFAIQQGDKASRHTSSRTVETVVYSMLQSANVEIVEVAVESRIAIMGFEVSVVLCSEPLAEEVAHMAEDYEDEIADVCGEEEIVGWFVFDGFWEFASLEPTGVEVALRTQWTKLRMLSLYTTHFDR